MAILLPRLQGCLAEPARERRHSDQASILVA